MLVEGLCVTEEAHFGKPEGRKLHLERYNWESFSESNSFQEEDQN
jgi:hypothetical protein